MEGKRVTYTILIPLEEYKELLEIKRRYKELKEANTIRIDRDGVHIPKK